MDLLGQLFITYAPVALQGLEDELVEAVECHGEKLRQMAYQRQKVPHNCDYVTDLAS